MALDTRTTRLADTIAALFVLMGSVLGGACTLVAQDPEASAFARQVRALITEDVARSNEAPEGIRTALRHLYELADMRPLWTTTGQPTRRADDVMAFLAGVERKGLRPADYDIDALRRRAAMLAGPDADTAALAAFDVALSRSLVRLLSHLNAGRIDPRAVGFDLPTKKGAVDLSIVARAVIDAGDVAQAIAAVEPRHPGYSSLMPILARYRALAADSTLRPPVFAAATIRPGDRNAGLPPLRRLLVALGDLAADAPVVRDSTGSEIYVGPIVDAVVAFQGRHGLDPDGLIGRATLAQLRVPPARRVRQIELALERWRWLPDPLGEWYVMVNTAAFRLSVYDGAPRDRRPALSMGVIVGQADGRHHTPVFAATMREVVVRPFWEVPTRIARLELVPLIRRQPGYLEREGIEIVGAGEEGVVYPPTAGNLNRVAAGTLRLRQRPGPQNALGLLKFVFPNRYTVFMHDTPARSLFSRARRDFSHGCIRVEDPVGLAEWVLRDQPGWDRSAIVAAMDGDTTRRVPVADPVPVYVFYVTAVAEESGRVEFHDDLYGHDARLDRALAGFDRAAFRGFPDRESSFRLTEGAARPAYPHPCSHGPNQEAS